MTIIIKNLGFFLLLFLNNSRPFNVSMLVNCKLYLHLNSDICHILLQTDCEVDIHLSNCGVALRCVILKTMPLPLLRRKYKFSTRNDWTSVALHFFLVYTYSLRGLMRVQALLLSHSFLQFSSHPIHRREWRTHFKKELGSQRA